MTITTADPRADWEWPDGITTGTAETSFEIDPATQPRADWEWPDIRTNAGEASFEIDPDRLPQAGTPARTLLGAIADRQRA